MRDPIDRRLSVAPMMDWTDRHCRYFQRLIAPRALLYTEMIPTGAILHGDAERLLRFDPAEHPVALQLGGSDPDELARVRRARRRARLRRDQPELRLPVGARAERALRRLPDGRARAGRRLRARRCAPRPTVPVTVKCRDRHRRAGRRYDFLRAFRRRGRRRRLPHLHRARAQGLAERPEPEGEPRDPAAALRAGAPRQARVPGARDRRQRRHPLARAGARAARQGRRRDDRPRGLPEPLVAGRLAARAARRRRAGPEPVEVVERLLPYVERELAEGTPLRAITRHMLGLFNGLPGARAWRRRLSEAAHRPGAGAQLLLDAMSAVRMAATPRDEAPRAAAA